MDREEYPYLDLRADEHADLVLELRRVYGEVRKTLLPGPGMLPTKENLSGVVDLKELRRLGLLLQDR